MKKAKMTIEWMVNLPWHYCSEASIWEGQKGYWISVAELPDCGTFAPSLEEGLAKIAGLLREYLTVALAAKTAIPLPETSDDLSLAGNLSLRIPISLHMGVKNAARLQKTSINQFAVKALTEAVTRSAKPSQLAVNEADQPYNVTEKQIPAKKKFALRTPKRNKSG
jgi:predicted HicB family RNase H-like nuclease